MIYKSIVYNGGINDIMFNAKSKAALASLICAAALILSACDTADEPGGVQNPSLSEDMPVSVSESETFTAESEEITDGTSSDTEVTTPEESFNTSFSTEETGASSAEVSETTPETTPALPWTETPLNGTLYINTDGVYSRKDAIQGSEKVTRYSLNDTVTVVARTDTDYFKLDTGAFIHTSYVSENKIEITVTSSSATTAATTVTTTTTEAAVTTTAAPPAVTASETVTSETSASAETVPEETSETAAPALGQYGQRQNTQAELDFIAKVFELVNIERESRGLTAYQHLDVLDTIASIRAWELTVDYRPNHIRPNGESCTSAFNENGIIYGAWGENIAAGQETPEEVVQAWLDSPGHCAAMLSADYTHMGVGFYLEENGSDGYKYYWTQEFYRY